MSEWWADVSYNTHANAKLTVEQKEYIARSGQSESEWLREAAEMRILKERANDQEGGHNRTVTPDTLTDQP